MTARPPASPVPPLPRPPVAPGGGGWRRTPPAIFPPILGLWGLGLGWRAAGEAAGFGPAPGEVILGAVFLLWLGALVAYGAKVARRPGVLAEEVRVLPGQSGLAALGMATMAGAGGVLPLRRASGRRCWLPVSSRMWRWRSGWRGGCLPPRPRGAPSARSGT